MPWLLDLRSGFELSDPAGKPVTLPYRKVQDLLKMLVESDSPLPKDEITAILWPEASLDTRQVNLRQAIYRLRSAIGADNLVTDTVTCSLSPSFELKCNTSPRALPSIPADEALSTPVTGFVQLLRWFSERDPMQMLDMMRANMDLSLGIWPSDLRELLENATLRLPVNHRLLGWMAFWRGYEGLVSHDIERARSLFNLAVEEAVKEKDYALVGEAILWLGGSDILLCRFESAQRIADQGAHMMALLSDRSLRAKVDQLKGTILIHQARTQEGLRVLEEACGSNEHRLLDHAQSQGLRALYHACAGETAAALRLLDQPRKMADETRHFRLESICGLANGYVALAEGDRDSALRTLSQVVDASARGKMLHFEIYGREACAVALWLLGERDLAGEQIQSSRKARREVKMAYTDWDRLRLRPLAKDS